jgi:hypothetical protein
VDAVDELFVVSLVNGWVDWWLGWSVERDSVQMFFVFAWFNDQSGVA